MLLVTCVLRSAAYTAARIARTQCCRIGCRLNPLCVCTRSDCTMLRHGAISTRFVIRHVGCLLWP